MLFIATHQHIPEGPSRDLIIIHEIDVPKVTEQNRSLKKKRGNICIHRERTDKCSTLRNKNRNQNKKKKNRTKPSSKGKERNGDEVCKTQ